MRRAQAITGAVLSRSWGAWDVMEVGVDIRAVFTGELPCVLGLKDGEEM